MTLRNKLVLAKLEPVIGHDQEISRMIQILSRKTRITLY